VSTLSFTDGWESARERLGPGWRVPAVAVCEVAVVPCRAAPLRGMTSRSRNSGSQMHPPQHAAAGVVAPPAGGSNSECLARTSHRRREKCALRASTRLAGACLERSRKARLACPEPVEGLRTNLRANLEPLAPATTAGARDPEHVEGQGAPAPCGSTGLTTGRNLSGQVLAARGDFARARSAGERCRLEAPGWGGRPRGCPLFAC
jgi:hypothetical protein